MWILNILMTIFLIADFGLLGLNTWAARKKQDWLWFGFSVLAIILLIISAIIFIGGLIYG